MRYLDGQDAQAATQWMRKAGDVAGKALCLRAKCGSVIIKDGEIIGEGYNAPPLDDLAQRMCTVAPSLPGKPRYDRTCCMHAEWRAILDALRRNAAKLPGSQLFFVRVDDDGNSKKSGQPYCTVCSRLALDVGIAEFFLWHEQGICGYPTDEYNQLSYRYVAPTV